jgi:hypothetical protein
MDDSEVSAFQDSTRDQSGMAKSDIRKLLSTVSKKLYYRDGNSPSLFPLKSSPFPTAGAPPSWKNSVIFKYTCMSSLLQYHASTT